MPSPPCPFPASTCLHFSACPVNGGVVLIGVTLVWDVRYTPDGRLDIHNHSTFFRALSLPRLAFMGVFAWWSLGEAQFWSLRSNGSTVLLNLSSLGFEGHLRQQISVSVPILRIPTLYLTKPALCHLSARSFRPLAFGFVCRPCSATVAERGWSGGGGRRWLCRKGTICGRSADRAADRG